MRAFLAVAAVLIIAMPLLGEKAAPLAQLTPMDIALAITGLGLLAFIIRFIAWRRNEAQERKNNIASAEKE